jgi:ABC-type multidrug transport system fused ATPase/permease subunit
VLTIAHRLQTIIDSDRIMVLRNGVVAEMDAPKTLLANPDGLFTSMWKQHNANSH